MDAEQKTLTVTLSLGAAVVLIKGISLVIDWASPSAPATAPAPTPAPPLAPAPRTIPASPRPTITSEELEYIELAYESTWRDIERRGKRLRIDSAQGRAAFIRNYQGAPNIAAVSTARDIKLPWFNIREVSQEDIVAAAKAERGPFLKVRMIHDWVADVFAYDYDYLWRMQNITNRNEEYTLREIVRLQRGVCFEYAILFYFLLDAVGLDTYLISDHSAPGIGHAYNMVVINGTGYIIDATWDSGNRYENGRIVEFKRMVSKQFFMPGIAQSYAERGW